MTKQEGQNKVFFFIMCHVGGSTKQPIKGWHYKQMIDPFHSTFPGFKLGRRTFHGLSGRQTTKLAWEYAKANLNPDAWDINHTSGIDLF